MGAARLGEAKFCGVCAWKRRQKGKRDGTVCEGESEGDRTERIRDYRIIAEREKDEQVESPATGGNGRMSRG